MSTREQLIEVLVEDSWFTEDPTSAGEAVDRWTAVAGPLHEGLSPANLWSLAAQIAGCRQYWT